MELYMGWIHGRVYVQHVRDGNNIRINKGVGIMNEYLSLIGLVVILSMIVCFWVYELMSHDDLPTTPEVRQADKVNVADGNWHQLPQKMNCSACVWASPSTCKSCAKERGDL